MASRKVLIVSETADGKQEVYGSLTYEVRRELKDLGGEYDPDTRRWKYDKDVKAAVKRMQHTWDKRQRDKRQESKSRRARTAAIYSKVPKGDALDAVRAEFRAFADANICAACRFNGNVRFCLGERGPIADRIPQRAVLVYTCGSYPMGTVGCVRRLATQNCYERYVQDLLQWWRDRDIPVFISQRSEG